MKPNIQKTKWQGLDGFSIENSGLRVVVVPETGGRIVSLFDKYHEHEWLLAPGQSHPTRKIDYGADFNTLTPGGWDEMFPTIISGNYPAPGKLNGVSLPDHGEVWTLPWSLDADEDQLTLSVQGQALPYHLARSIALAGTQEIHFFYTLTNLSDEPLYYLWTAHPQFACNPGYQILLPPAVHQVVNVLPLERGAEWGAQGTINAWPARIGEDGLTYPQDIVRSPERKTGRKFYILPDQPIGWAALLDPISGAHLRMSWDATVLPYFGVWIDEGSLNQVASVAFEPASGYYDAITLAWNNKRLSMVEPEGTHSWEIIIRFNSLTD